jgi:hypothetical protein
MLERFDRHVSDVRQALLGWPTRVERRGRCGEAVT